MKLATRIYNFFVPPRPARTVKRKWSAARYNRLNADWTVTPQPVNQSLYTDLRILRARARQMSHDSPHFKKFLKMVRTNVIGSQGLQLQVRARKLDGSLNARLNKRVADTFWEWCFAENCTVTQKLNWKAAQRLFVTALARDGEVLVQHVPAKNAFGYAIKFWNIDWLDETYNEMNEFGNQIIMSVEVDKNGRPVAYWLTPPAGDLLFAPQKQRDRKRIPAEEMIHSYLIEDAEEQVRGVTWFHAALLEGKYLQGYKEGVLTSARMTAMSGGFFTKTSDDETELIGETDEETGEEQSLAINFSPASFHIAPDGYDFKQFDPKQPTQNHAEFVRQIESDLAAGLGVNYFSLSGDMSAVNYSSARVGLGEERDGWRELQEFVGEMFCRPVYHAWCRSSMLSGKLKLTGREFEEIQNPIFRPRGWRYVDPQKEIAAYVMGLENKLMSWTDVLADQGIDITEHLETLKQEQQLAEMMGIDLSVASSQPVAEPESEPKDEDDSETEIKTGEDEEDRAFTNGNFAY